jgi:hypothetical protein
MTNKAGRPKGIMTYVKGDDEMKPDATMMSFGIHRLVDGKEIHGNIIEVHGDALLRDALLLYPQQPAGSAATAAGLSTTLAAYTARECVSL